MGLIKAVFNAAGGVLADQWVDFFSCDAMPNSVRGNKKTSPCKGSGLRGLLHCSG